MIDQDRNDSSAVLVGRLIRSYRHDFSRDGRRLSQDGLLDLMVERGEDYADNLDRSSVSNWERGTRPVPHEFLLAFGRALEISPGEMDGLLILAGYEGFHDAERQEELLAVVRRLESQAESLQRDMRSIANSTVGPYRPVDAASVIRNAAWRIAPPGIYALVVGFVLNVMGLNGTLALLAYVVITLAIVVGQGVLRWLKPRKDSSERKSVEDLFFISLFFTLNTSLLIGTLTKADHFGFYTFEAFRNTPVPFLLTTLVNLVLSVIGSAMFSILWDRQYGFLNQRNAFFRAVWITLPPLLFVYANIVVFANLGAWIYFFVVFGILFGAFTTIVALNEPDFVLTDGDFLFRTAIVTTVILCTFGVIGMVLSYLEPDIQITAAYLRVIPLPEVSPQELGYGDERGVQLLRLGSMWMSLATMVYLVTIVGGYLLVTIRRASK